MVKICQFLILLVTLCSKHLKIRPNLWQKLTTEVLSMFMSLFLCGLCGGSLERTCETTVGSWPVMAVWGESLKWKGRLLAWRCWCHCPSWQVTTASYKVKNRRQNTANNLSQSESVASTVNIWQNNASWHCCLHCSPTKHNIVSINGVFFVGVFFSLCAR